MQKGTVIEGEVLHDPCTAQDSDGDKVVDNFSKRERKEACIDPARNIEEETVTSSVKDNPVSGSGNADIAASAAAAPSESQFQSHIPYAKPEADLCSSIRSIGGVRPKRIGAFLTRVFTVVLAAVMTVSLGSFASDALNTLDASGAYEAGAQSAYAATGTTPYTNIDVPLTSNSNSGSSNNGGNTNNSDNANLDRVEAADGDDADSETSTVLGPLPSDASSRTSVDGEDAQSTDGDSYEEDQDDSLTYTDRGLTYIRNESGDDEDYYTYTLTYADPKIGKVAILPSDVTAIAAGAFVDCQDLETIIVYGTIKSIAKTERDLFGNVTRQGAFTEDQLKNVHVVFAVNYIEAIDDGIVWDDGSDDSHDHDHDSILDDEALDAEEAAEAARNAQAKALKEASKERLAAAFDEGNSTNDADAADAYAPNAETAAVDAAATDQADTDADDASTPVDQGIERLSADVFLSTSASDIGSRNAWADLGFENLVAAPAVGASGTHSQNDANSQIDGVAQDDTSTESGFIFTLLSDYTLEVAWNGDADMPLDLTLPDYGQVEGTTYQVTHVAEGGFGGSDTLASLTIPEGITAINGSAFADCSSLATATLPSTLQAIGAYAFANCPSLVRIALDDIASSSDGAEYVNDADGDKEAGDNADGDLDTDSGISLYSVDDTAFENSAADISALASTSEEVTRSTYANHTATTEHWVEIRPNGGKYGDSTDTNVYSYRFSSKANANKKEYEDITGRSSNLKMYWGDEGYVCIKVDYGRGYTSSEGVVGTGTAEDADGAGGNVQRFRLVRTGYTFWEFKKVSGPGVVVDCGDDRAYHPGSSSKAGGSVLEAVWDPNVYTISFNPHGGTIYLGDQAQNDDYEIGVYYDGTYNEDGLFPSCRRPGYTFNGWYTAATGGTKIEGTTDMTTARDHTLHAHWTANTNTPYKVNHYQQNLGSTGTATTSNSTLVATENKTGTTAASTAAAAKSYAGFTAQSFSQATINGNGTTVVNIFYTRNSYTLTLSAGTGIASVSGGGSKQYGASVSASTTANTGYHFVNWTGTYTSTANPYTFNMPASNVSLTANGAPNPYKITYNKNKPSNASHDVTGTTGDSNNQSSHTYDESKNLSASGFALVGWTQKGWNTKADGTGTPYENGASVKNLTDAYNGTVTLYAQWVANTYTVTYNSNKPSNATSNVTGTTANSSHIYDTAKNLTSNGYSLKGWRFNGWNTAANGTGTSYSNGASVKSLTSTNGATVTLYAQWVANPYTVTYNANKPSNATSSVAGTTASSSHIYDTAKSLTTNGYSLVGWTFKGWNTAANGSGTSYSNGASVKNLTDEHNGTVTLYAQWTANTYYVSYNANFSASAYPNSTLLYNGMPSSNTMPLSTHIYDTAKELSANLYGVTGYDFNGWSRNANGTGDQYTNRHSVKNLSATQGDTVVIYAKWALHTYSIDINTLGGKMPSATPTSYNINSSTIYIGNPTRPGYDFYGWSVTGAGEYGRTPILNTDPAQIVAGTYGNLLFTASWGEIKYSVLYNFNGGVGNSIETQMPTYGEPFTVAMGTGVISRDGYTFSRYWNTFADGSGDSYREGTSAMNLTTLSGDKVVLYAIWDANRYALTLDAQGGTLPDAANWTPSDDRSKSTKQATFDSPMGTLLVPTRVGYEFAGWYNDLGENVTSTTVYSQASPMTLYARWTPHVYDVYFYKGEVGATGSMEPLQFYYGTEKPLTPNAFEYKGHTFLGWSRTQGAAAPTYRDGEAVSNLTPDQNGVVFLYAVWSENHYAINYHANGADVAEGFDDPYRVEEIAYTKRFWPPHASDLGFSLTGYTFAGWSDTADPDTGSLHPSTDQVESLTDQDDVTVNLWAIWTPTTYRLTLDATGGRFDATLFQTVGQIWSPETNYVGAYRQVRYDEQYLCTIEPAWTGYDFAGWYTEPQSDPYVAGSGDGVPVSASDPFKNLEDTTLYAHWTPHTYTLNLVYYNSESMTDTILLGQTLYFNEPFVLPTAGYMFEDVNFPSYGHTLKDYQHTGFAVSGWSITRDGETNYRLGQTISGLDAVGDPDKPYTLYLTQAAGRYTVEFDPGVAPGVEVENLMLPETWLYTDYVDVPWCSMRRTGYTFTYWTTNVDDRTYTPGYGQKFHEMVDIGETLVLTAHWKANEITLRFMDGGVADRTITYDTQITRVAKAVSDSKLTFEGWYTKNDGSLDECYFDWNGNVNQRIEAIYPYWHDAGNENGVVELWAKWTFEVTFEFPYGGRDVSITSSNYSAGQTYGDPSNATNFRPSYGLPVPKYNGLDSNVDDDGNVRRFAGWYDKPVGGNLVTNDTLATGPVQPDPWSDYEDVVLYARWYVDVTLDYPTYAPYTQGWAFEYGRDLAHAENDREQVVVSYVQGIPYAGDASFVLGLPRAERAGYAYLGWNANARQVIYDGESRLFDGEIQSGDTVTSERNYTIYLEYAKRKVGVTVRYWQQVIEGVDADGNPTIGAVPSIYSDDIYTANGHYKLVEADTRTEPLFSEERIEGDDYHEDPESIEGRYRGFTYHATLISKDANADGGTDPDSLLIWNGTTTPDQAKDNVYDGCAASDSTSVIDVFYTRNRYDVTLHDFKVVDGAGETQVRGSAHARANSSNALAYSPTEASEMPGRTQTLSAWFEEEITAVGRSWAGYDFSGWDIAPEGLGYSKDVVNEDPSVRLEGDVYTLTVTDSDMEMTPRCAPRDDTEYHATLHYQGLTSATSVEEDREIWPTSAQIRLKGTTDVLTDWVVRANATDPNAANVIEGKAVGTSDFNVTGFPEDVAFEGTYVFDPHGFTGVDLQNAVIRAESDEAIHVYYARNAYSMDVVGYEATHKDGTPVGDEGRIEAYLWDNMAGGPVEKLESASVDAGQDRNKASYAIYFHAPLSVVAVPHEGTELLGYASSNADIWNAKGLAEYAADLGIELDANPLVDSAGLANASPNNPYTFRYAGESAPYPMPIVPDGADGAKETLVLTIDGQPARTSYEIVVLGQDKGDEVTPGATYSQIGDAREFASVTIDGQTRLLRYWQDGTYVSTNADDPSYVPVIEGFGLSDSYTPTLFGYETFDGHGIVDLTELTPDGNASFHGTSNAPLNKAYVYMDRNARSLDYEYVVDDGYADVVSLDDDVMSTLPSTIGTYFGAEVKVAGDPSVNGWEFLGWTWAQDPDAGRDDFPYVGEDTDSESVTIPDFDVEITGTWAPIEYGLSFDGGTAYEQSPAEGIPSDMSIPYNSEWAVPDDVPERAGYAFLGWTFADKAIFEAMTGGPIDLATGDVDECKATLSAMDDFDGNPLLMEPGQSQVWTWHEGDRTLHAVWMRNSYDVTFDLGQGTWPNGTSVPLTYMTGAEVKVPQPASEGYMFTGWEVTCDGSELEGDAPAVSYADGDPTRATINAWTYGNMTFTAKYDVKRFAVSLNPAGGTFDGEPEEFMDREIDYTSPDGNGTYGQATVHIPYQTEITSITPLPEPERPGYDFSGWTDAEGNPVGWTLDDDGNKVEVPYMFDDAKDATWVATWRAHRYKVTYDFGEYADSVTIQGIDAFSEYFAGMADADGNAVTSFMLPTADDIEGLPENVGFDGWYPAGGNPDSDRMRSFDPNVETGDKVFVAVFSKGANVYNERFWLEVLDQSEDVEGRQYAFIGETKFALDETLSVTRRTDSPNAQASMSAISGFVPVNPYDAGGVSIYPTEHPYVCVFIAGQNTVNGFYTREAHSLTVGTATGIDDDETMIQVGPASALVKDADIEDDAYAMDADSNTATLKGASSATVKWGAKVNVGVTCPRETGYEFVAWQTDAGATPADIDVRSNPAAFTMPDANVALNPSTELVHFKATYRDAFGKDVLGAGQATFTVNDEFALKNLDDVAGHAFRGWEAYVSDEDGNRLDPEANPVPSTVGYDEDLKHMWVREGTATDLIFEASYAAVEYSVSVTLPKGTAYLANGMPDGLPEIEGIDWVLMPGSDGIDAIGFNYTVEDLGAPLVVDLTGINCAPYEVNSWRVAGTNGESNVPSLEGGVLTLIKDNLGDWRLDPEVSPIRYELTLDLSDVREGYVPIDVDALASELESAGYVVERIEDGKLKVAFDVETADAYELPSFEREDEGSTPEFAFRGWAKAGDASNASNPYILPPADIAGWPKEGTVIAPVWARSGEQATLVAHLPNDDGAYVDDLKFTFVGDALTPIDYAQDERFVGLVNDVDDENVGYHLVWHGTPGLTDDDVTTLPVNFPESGTQEVWGEWVEDDDIITVGFGVKWDNSAPPGETKPRSAFALNAAEVVSDDVDSDPASAFSMRNAYLDDVATIDEADDAVETPVADANSTYYYIPNKGLYVKDVRGKYHIVTRISNIDDIAGTYAGWRLEGFYLPIDEQKPERIIIGPDGEVDNATFVEVAGAKPSDLTFTVRWARISLVEIDMVGGYGEGSEDLTLYYWPEKDVFVKGDDDAIGDMYSAPRAYSKDDFNTGVMLGTFAIKGIPEAKEDADGTRAFIGYFGETAGRKWDLAKDAEGNPLPAADALALTPIFSYLAVTDDHGKQVTVGTDAIELPYGYDDKDDATAYDPTSKDGTTKVTWRAAWEGDLDAIYFNATVPMSMSFMVRADGTAIGPEAGAYQIRNYSNTAISVEDMTFEWAEESELEALFGKGATDALALSATPTDGQPGYAQTKVLLERANATQDAVGAALVSRYVFGADKWVIAKSVGVDPGDFTGDATALPALKLDYDLTSGGIRQLTQENASQDTTHPIGTLKFTLKTVR